MQEPKMHQPQMQLLYRLLQIVTEKNKQNNLDKTTPKQSFATHHFVICKIRKSAKVVDMYGNQSQMNQICGINDFGKHLEKRQREEPVHQICITTQASVGNPTKAQRPYGSLQRIIEHCF